VAHHRSPPPTPRAAARARTLAAALAATLALTGCTAASGEGSSFHAASDGASRAVVVALLEAARQADLEGMAARHCEPSAVERTRAELSLEGADRSFEILRTEPAWAAAEPYFRVDVRLTRGGAAEDISLAVRARDACVDRLLGVPLAPAAIPEPPPAAAPPPE
jgi:hypothetical protein